MVCSALFLWSINTSFLRLIYQEGVSPFTMAFFRNMIASMTLFMIFSLFAKQRKALFTFPAHSKRYLLLLSFLFAVSTITYIYAVSRTTIANVLLIADTSVISTLLISYFWLKEKITPIKIIALILTFIGIGIIILPGYQINLFSQQTYIGDLMALINSVVWGAWYAVSRKLGASVSSITTTAWSLLVSGLMFLPFALGDLLDLNITAKAWVYIIFTAIGAQSIGTLLLHTASRKLEASIISLLTPVEVVFGVIFAFFLLKEAPYWYTYLGGCFIIFAIVLVAISQRRGARVVEWGALEKH